MYNPYWIPPVLHQVIYRIITEIKLIHDNFSHRTVKRRAIYRIVLPHSCRLVHLLTDLRHLPWTSAIFTLSSLNSSPTTTKFTSRRARRFPLLRAQVTNHRQCNIRECRRLTIIRSSTLLLILILTLHHHYLFTPNEVNLSLQYTRLNFDI